MKSQRPLINAGKQSMQNKKTADQKSQEHSDCRCKEVSKKTPSDLLKLAINDLAFWKKRTSKQ
jgi:hypothetical protein